MKLGMKFSHPTCPVEGCGAEAEYTLETVLVHYSLSRGDDGSYEHDGNNKVFDESCEYVQPEDLSGPGDTADLWSRDREVDSSKIVVGHNAEDGMLHEWVVQLMEEDDEDDGDGDGDGDVNGGEA